MQRLAVLLAVLSLAPSAVEAQPPSSVDDEGHGPNSRAGFSHRFTPRARVPNGAQLSFHYGLLQPVLLRGFNAAVDVRRGRFIATYSHGQGLDLPKSTLTRAERNADVGVRMNWSTGFGVGLVLVDELYLLADFKVHDVTASHAEGSLDYKTVTVGLELGYRLFLWRGLHVGLAVRYWPTVFASIDRDGVELADTGLTHEPIAQGLEGFFANVLIGWAFDVR
ncbi:MAG: hypothetical protein MUE69_16150 [Myxococcota bacterium]|jgi:hypothetical protein|nr:hypothetical protein [Myxococcota bacterium]